MAWKKSNNNDIEVDLWGKKNNHKKDYSNDLNKNKKNNKEYKNIFDFKKFILNITHLISKKQYTPNSSYSSNFSKNIINSLIIIFFIVFCIWCASGFYIIKEAERGVVTNFGKFSHVVKPGLNWRPVFINEVQSVNVETVRELATSGMMLTADENVVKVEMNVQYKITDPKDYLFSVDLPDDSLRQATDSALRGIIGHSTMDRVLTEGRTLVRSDTQKEIEETIKPYKMGISILDVNFQTARPPEEVKSSFDDAIAARENREQYVREAEAYSNEVQPKAHGNARRILEEAKSYSSRIILEAEGEIIRFSKILPEYKKSKKITLQRIYIESMERLFKKSKKIFIDKKNNTTFLFSLNDIFNNKKLNKKYFSNSPKLICNHSRLKENKKKNFSSFSTSHDLLVPNHIHSTLNNAKNIERK